MTVPATVTISAAVEGSLDEAAVSRLIRDTGGLPGTVYGKNGKSYLRDRIRHGHPSTLHLWWARRPLASSRAVLLALLLPDPCDPLCPRGNHEKRLLDAMLLAAPR